MISAETVEEAQGKDGGDEEHCGILAFRRSLTVSADTVPQLKHDERDAHEEHDQIQGLRVHRAIVVFVANRDRV